MTERISVPEELVAGLTTKSAKIRKLAEAGYSRPEISRILGISYQHVRNVLVVTGRTGAEGTPAGRSTSPAAMQIAAIGMHPPDDIIRAGFRRVGDWKATATGILLDGKAPDEPGVYIFVLDGGIAYIGHTRRSLRECMGQYRRGDLSQKTRARIRRHLVNSLEGGHSVTVLVATPPASEWNGLPVSTIAGLEIGLIRMLTPPWNALR